MQTIDTKEVLVAEEEEQAVRGREETRAPSTTSPLSQGGGGAWMRGPSHFLGLRRLSWQEEDEEVLEKSQHIGTPPGIDYDPVALKEPPGLHSCE